MTGVSVCAWCVCAYEGALRSTDLSNYLDSLAAASSCDVVSALGLLLLPFGLSRTVSSDVPSSPSDCMLACSKGADHGHRSPTDDATTNRRCVHAQLTHRPPPGTTWHTRRWRQYGVGTAGRSASWIGCRTCFSRFLRHRGPDDISRGWPGHGESSCTFPLRDVCISSNAPERCDGPSGKGNPAKGPGFALARKTRVEKGEGVVRRAWGGERTVDAARVSWTGPVRLRGGRGKSSR